MDRLKTVAKNLMAPRAILTMIIVAIFIAAAVYAYRSYVQPKMNPDYVPNSEFVSKGSSSPVATIYYFTAEWCPVSKRAFPQWERFVKDFNGKKINGYELRTMVVDCEKEPDMADKFNIEGYPTVKLAFKNQVVEYDANVKYDTLVQFVNTTLGESQ